MVNRVFPLKVIVRICANLTQHTPIHLPTLHEHAAECAALLGSRLAVDDTVWQRKRNEGRAVALPTGSDLQKSKVRFAFHFVGRRTSTNEYTGGAFDTGMIAPMPEDKDLIALTPLGAAFAMLKNPVLDTPELGDRNLSSEECDFYLTSVAPQASGERNAFGQVLSALEQGPRTPEEIADLVRPRCPAGSSESVATTARSGAISRLVDVGAVSRHPQGRSALLSLTETGRCAAELLGKTSHD